MLIVIIIIIFNFYSIVQKYKYDPKNKAMIQRALNKSKIHKDDIKISQYNRKFRF